MEEQRWYIDNFGYHNFISGYGYFFKINENKNFDKYKNDANGEMIIDLFNFNRTISRYCLSNILSIERKLTNFIITEILAKYINDRKILKSEELKSGKWFDLSDDDLILIFPGVKKYINLIGSSQKLNRKQLADNYLSLKEILKNGTSKLDNENLNYLCGLGDNWSFGNVLLIFKLLSSDLKIFIIKRILQKKYYDYDSLKWDFYNILVLLNDVRNIICHNNILYNLNYAKNKICIKKFMHNMMKINSNNIRLISLVKIIDFLNKNTADKKLENLIFEAFDKCKSILPRDKKIIKNYICKP